MKISLRREDVPYAPYFCEENVYRLAELLVEGGAGVLRSDAGGPGIAGPVAGRNRAYVVFVTNRNRQVAMARQRSDSGRIVLWDYHVFFLSHAAVSIGVSMGVSMGVSGGTSGRALSGASGWIVWDAESIGPLPCPVASYLSRSFPKEIPGTYRPTFRTVDATVYLSDFASDRRHMLDARGNPVYPLPPWPPIRAERGSNLAEILDLRSEKWGRRYSLEAFAAEFAR